MSAGEKRSVILIHGRDFKPAADKYLEIAVTAIGVGLERDYPDCAPLFDAMHKDLAWYGDLNAEVLTAPWDCIVIGTGHIGTRILAAIVSAAMPSSTSTTSLARRPIPSVKRRKPCRLGSRPCMVSRRAGSGLASCSAFSHLLLRPGCSFGWSSALGIDSVRRSTAG